MMAFGVDEEKETKERRKKTLETFESLLLFDAQHGLGRVVAVCHLR